MEDDEQSEERNIRRSVRWYVSFLYWQRAVRSEAG